MVCNTKLKHGGCGQKSARLDTYNDQLEQYFGAFDIPADYREKLLDIQANVQKRDESAQIRSRLESAKQRLRDMYEWGHISEEKYKLKYAQTEQDIMALPTEKVELDVIGKYALYLKDIGLAWKDATEEQKNKLARVLLDSVWIKDQAVLGVTPRAEVKPLFDLQYSGLSNDVLQWRPRPDSNRRSSA